MDHKVKAFYHLYVFACPGQRNSVTISVSGLNVTFCRSTDNIATNQILRRQNTFLITISQLFSVRLQSTEHTQLNKRHCRSHQQLSSYMEYFSINGAFQCYVSLEYNWQWSASLLLTGSQTICGDTIWSCWTQHYTINYHKPWQIYIVQSVWKVF